MFYVRFMDDILVLAPTHAKLRCAVKTVNTVLASLRLEKHPDKTFIGRIAKGFDFLGYHFGSRVLELAEATIKNFVEQATLLYEQGRRERVKAPLLGTYVRRWLGWAKGGLPPGVILDLPQTVPIGLTVTPSRNRLPSLRVTSNWA